MLQGIAIDKDSGDSDKGSLEQWSPTFLVPWASFVEDKFSMDWWRGRGGSRSGGNASDGERQM